MSLCLSLLTLEEALYKYVTSLTITIPVLRLRRGQHRTLNLLFRDTLINSSQLICSNEIKILFSLRIYLSYRIVIFHVVPDSASIDLFLFLGYVEVNIEP